MAGIVMMVLDVVILGLGIYMACAGVEMHKTGDVGKVLAEEDVARCHDKGGFAEAVYRREVIFGAVAVVVGFVGIVDELVSLPNLVSIIRMLVFLGTFVWFQMGVNRAKSEFLT